MQAAFQKHTDNAVSKTVNLPSAATQEDVSNVFDMAWRLGCKGITVYRTGSRESQVLTTGAGRAAAATATAPELSRQGGTRPRPRVVRGETHKMDTGCGSLYVTINRDGVAPFEVFNTMGKAGGCPASQSEAIGRLASLALRNGIPAAEVVHHLRGITCHRPHGFGDNRTLSCPDAIARALAAALDAGGEPTRPTAPAPSAAACPECGCAMEPDGGCLTCRACSHSECG
jgi:ribonucleoside-diphosphate reductase alpha chain